MTIRLWTKWLVKIVQIVACIAITGGCAGALPDGQKEVGMLAEHSPIVDGEAKRIGQGHHELLLGLRQGEASEGHHQHRRQDRDRRADRQRDRLLPGTVVGSLVGAVRSRSRVANSSSSATH